MSAERFELPALFTVLVYSQAGHLTHSPPRTHILVGVLGNWTRTKHAHYRQRLYRPLATPVADTQNLAEVEGFEPPDHDCHDQKFSKLP